MALIQGLSQGHSGAVSWNRTHLKIQLRLRDLPSRCIHSQDIWLASMTLSGCWVPCHVGVSMGMLTTWPLASLGVSHLGDYLVLEMKAVACYDLISRVACPRHLPLVTQANPGTVGWGAMNQERETIGDHSGDCPPQTDSQKKKNEIFAWPLFFTTVGSRWEKSVPIGQNHATYSWDSNDVEIQGEVVVSRLVLGI